MITSLRRDVPDLDGINVYTLRDAAARAEDSFEDCDRRNSLTRELIIPRFKALSRYRSIVFNPNTFGIEGAQELNHAKRIMKEVQIDSDIQQQVLEALSCIGYSKALKGIRPKTIEGKIVSDADMCDAIGATGILRAYTYSMKKGKPFFNKDVFPIENLNADTYIQRCSDSSCNHFFEKLLKLKGMMMTEAGKKEAKHRHEIMVSFLYHYFEEENVPEWREYLDNYLKLKI